MRLNFDAPVADLHAFARSSLGGDSDIGIADFKHRFELDRSRNGKQDYTRSFGFDRFAQAAGDSGFCGNRGKTWQDGDSAIAFFFADCAVLSRVAAFGKVIFEGSHEVNLSTATA